MPKSNKPTWKDAERKIARILGAQILDDETDPKVQRVPVTGRGRGNAPDVRHPFYSLEIKHGRRAISAFLADAWDQAVKSVRGEQIPMVILHKHGTPYDDSLVVIRLADLEKFRQFGTKDTAASTA